MRFLVHYEGKGEGCDYTIGCNHRVGIIDAADIDDVVNQVLNGIHDGEDEPDEILYHLKPYDKITFYPIGTPVAMELGAIRDAAREKKAKAAVGLIRRFWRWLW